MCDLHREEEQESPRCGITELVDELTVAVTNSRIYSSDHPRVQSSIAVLRRCLEALLKEEDSDQLVIGSAEGFLFYKRKPLLGASLSAARVIEALKAVGSGGLSLGRRSGDDDLRALIHILVTGKRDYPGIREANADLVQRGCRSIQFLPEYRGGDCAVGAPDSALHSVLGEHEVDDKRIEFDVPVELYQQTVALLQDAAVRACHGDDINIEHAKGSVEAILGRLVRDAVSLMAIARYERYDAYTFGHSIRVCFLALNFAASLSDDEELLQRIGLAALLHDIGKAWVPFDVLHSTAKLTPEERNEMNKHTTHGGEILLQLSEVDPLVVSTAFSHHQTLDGRGYPTTIHEVRQSVGTRIVKICDVYEALTAVRPYKPRMSPVRAYRVMISMKNHFDPVLLRRFIAVNGIYPAGSLVRLSTGEHARVMEQTADPRHPVVRTVADDLGGPLAPDPGLIRDLSRKDGPAQPQIVEFLENVA